MSYDRVAELAERQAVVYRAYDADGHLLYVGTTVHLKNRLDYHKCMYAKFMGVAGWYELAAYMVLNGPGPRREMLELEAWLIREFDPVWNVQGVRQQQRPDPARPQEWYAWRKPRNWGQAA